MDTGVAWKWGGLQQKSNCRTEYKDANTKIKLLVGKLWQAAGYTVSIVDGGLLKPQLPTRLHRKQ
jgi:hypothetical protein